MKSHVFLSLLVVGGAFALAGLVVPTASAGPCESCPPPPCVACILRPILAPCPWVAPVGVGPWVGVTFTTCTGGYVTYCSDPQARLPSPLLPGGVWCGRDSTIGLP